MLDIGKFLSKWLLMLIIVSIVAFGVVRLMPVSPVDIMLSSMSLPKTEENVKFLEEKWGLDKSLKDQYFIWIQSFLRGDWGESLITKTPLKEEWAQRIPYSVFIGIGGLLLAAVIAFFLGYGASLKERGFFDMLSKGLSLFSQTVPSFILSIVVIYLIGVKTQKAKIFTGDGKIGLILALIFTTISITGPLSRIVKTHFEEEMSETYILALISRGHNPNKVLLTKGYRKALHGLLSALTEKLSWIIGGTTVVEFAFSIPGMSFFLVESIHSRDYLVVQSYILIMFIWMFFVHLVIDTSLKLLVARGSHEG